MSAGTTGMPHRAVDEALARRPVAGRERAIDEVLAGTFGQVYGPLLWSKTRWHNDEDLRRSKAGVIVDAVLAALAASPAPAPSDEGRCDGNDDNCPDEPHVHAAGGDITTWHGPAPAPSDERTCDTCQGTRTVPWLPGQHRTSEDDGQPCPDCDGRGTWTPAPAPSDDEWPTGTCTECGEPTMYGDRHVQCAPGYVPPAAPDGPEVERLRAKVAAAEALCDEWESWAATRSTVRIDAFRDAADYLRAVLADEARVDELAEPNR